jgi:hypothetical protein
MKEYEVKLCMQMISYSVYQCKKANNRRSHEILQALSFFFEDDVMGEAKQRLLGEKEASHADA